MKTILVTGATSGIGRKLVFLLAKDYDLILLGRNEDLLKKTIVEIKEKNNIVYYTCDFENLELVSDVASKIKNDFKKIDGIIHNAGMLQKKKCECSENGFNKSLLVNFLSPFILNEMLLESLKKGNTPFIFHTTTMSIPKKLKIETLNEINSLSRIKAYANAKLAFYLYLKNLSNKENEIKFKIFDPTIVYTNAIKNMIPKHLQWLRPIPKILFKDPMKVALKAKCVITNNQDETFKFYRLAKEKNEKAILENVYLQKEVISFAFKILNENKKIDSFGNSL